MWIINIGKDSKGGCGLVEILVKIWTCISIVDANVIESDALADNADETTTSNIDRQQYSTHTQLTEKKNISYTTARDKRLHNHIQ